MCSRKDYMAPWRIGPSVAFKHSGPEENPDTGSL